jgi:hypothetical protein
MFMQIWHILFFLNIVALKNEDQDYLLFATLWVCILDQF